MMAAVTEVPLSEAVASCNSTEPMNVNFYDFLGTNGCLLNCEERKQLQSALSVQPRLGNAGDFKKKKEIRKSAREGSEGHFTLHDLATSIEKGCRSCKVLHSILEHVSLIRPEDVSNDTNVLFNVTASFVLSRRLGPVDNTTTTSEEIRLFHPHGFRRRCDLMSASHFLSGKTDSETSESRLLQWLDQCKKNHTLCNPQNTFSLPSRLIDVTELERGGEKGVRLVQTTVGQAGTYTCLSHCWGKVIIPCCTTKSSLAAALSFIEYRLFPKNFQDAITITRKLRIRYIWIDSLCILQGDKHDWDVESARMADVYRNGYLTIAATSSADSTGGCFSTTRPDLCLSLINDTGEQILVGARMCDTSGLLNNESDIANRAPLFTRGWVLQEMLISRRVLLCNYGEMAFECLEAKTCECGTRSFAPHGSGSIGLTKATTEQRALMAKLLHKGHDIANLWRSMVSDYMNLTLTCPTDILQAVSACAMVTFEVTGDQYLAGMWRKSLCRELCWTNRSKRRLPRHDEWTAPTWSWASIPLGQNITTFKMAVWRSFEPTIESAIGDRVITCLPKGNNKFGELTTATGQLKLDAALFPCLFRRFCKGDVSIEQPIMQRNQWGIYSEHPKPKMVATCQLPEPALNTQGGILEAFLDVPPRDALRFEIYPSCPVSTCSLASIALLHVCQIVDKKGLCLNYFMILKKVEAGHNIHERIGMALFHGHTVEQRKKWFREVWDKDIFLREEITIV